MEEQVHHDGERDAYVTSHHIAGFTSLCQRRAAYVLNSQRLARHEGRFDEMAYRGQQAGRARLVTGAEALYLTVHTGTALFFAAQAVANGSIPLASGPHVLVFLPLLGLQIGNTLRHTQTYNEAKEKLAEVLGSEQRAVEILGIEVRKNDVEEFARALEAEHIDTHDLRHSKGWYSTKDKGRMIIPLHDADVTPGDSEPNAPRPGRFPRLW